MRSLVHWQSAVVQFESAEGATLMHSDRLQREGRELAEDLLSSNGRTRDEWRYSACRTRIKSN